MTTPDADRRLNARVPAEAYRALEQVAGDEHRSLNAQLVVALEGWLFGHGPDWFRECLAERHNAPAAASRPR